MDDNGALWVLKIKKTRLIGTGTCGIFYLKETAKRPGEAKLLQTRVS
jgi:hypothetical protein